jgi:hypothetical protein
MPITAEQETGVHPVALGLRSTLERLADALTNVNLDTLLACEGEMASTLAAANQQVAIDPAAKAATARELLAARAALVRCSRLGATLADLTRLSLASQGVGQTYGRLGESRSATGVHAMEAKG